MTAPALDVQASAERIRPEETLYRPEAVRFQRFRMIGSPPPSAPAIGRALILGSAGLALCAAAMATASHAPRINGNVTATGAGKVTVVPDPPAFTPRAGRRGVARWDGGRSARFVVLPPLGEAGTLRVALASPPAGSSLRGQGIALVFDRERILRW